uniref:FlgD Ig-like domain-containing protein n=2 Tax=Candidatus Bipolaricaulota TaxID=67810 RepID=H5SG91_9BACT|nr:hypothetical protein HGMM_F23G10C30 [uncultured Acetothermia bacterium]BAL60218.1 hypothetical protein HGMM_OP4C854 [Candidatus Acetothermum autotrophicum]
MMMRQQALRGLPVGLAVVFVLGLGALAQSVSLTVTAYSDAVRFSAQGQVKELRVEVLSLSGQKVFDSGPVLGNALDWKLFNTQGQPVANGVYLYTVTVKDPFGNVTKKLGKLAVLRGKGIAAPPLSGITVGNLATGNPRLQVQWDITGNYTIQGNLGVGTETPAAPIHVLTSTYQTMIRMTDDRQTIDFRTFGSKFGALIATSPSTSVGFLNRAASGGIFVEERSPGIACLTNSICVTLATGWAFRVAAGVGGPERLTVLDTGNVGIGTSAPSAKLHINNTANQPGLRIDSSDGQNALEIYNTGSGSATGLIFRVERTTGNVYADGNFTGGGADVAERITVTESVEPGDVVEIDPDNPGKFRKAREALSTRVAGVISTAPGVVLGNKDAVTSSDTRPILALAGRVPVKATAKFGAISVGDLLVSSPIPGYAMKCPEASQCIGAVIGKALEPLTEGTGLIEVQVMLR